MDTHASLYEPNALRSDGRGPSESRMADEFARFLAGETLRSTPHEQGKSLRAWVDLAETYRIVQVLGECGGNRSAAARVLGIGRRTLYAKMDKLGISAAWRTTD